MTALPVVPLGARPGSREALAIGCVCTYPENEFGAGMQVLHCVVTGAQERSFTQTVWSVARNCPVHAAPVETAQVEKPIRRRAR